MRAAADVAIANNHNANYNSKCKAIGERAEQNDDI